MARETFTIKWLDALKPDPAGKQVIHWDKTAEGLCVRIGKDGRRTFLVDVNVKDGRRTRVAIGAYGYEMTLEQARERAGELTRYARKGIDLLADEERGRSQRASRLTFKNVAEEWLRLHVRPKRSKRTADDYAAHLRRHLYPAFEKRFADEITRGEVTGLHTRLKDIPKSANYVVVTGKALFNFAIKNGLVREDARNPFTGIELYPEDGRERYLSADEVGRIGAAIKELEADGRLSPWSAAALRLLMLTGARSGEIKSLMWSYVDFERRSLMLPTSKTGKKAIVLNPPALAILQALPRVNGNPYVIVGQVEGQPMVTLRQPWDLVRELTGLHDVRIHDLRHTFASFGVSSGLSLPMVGRILGHTVPATTARYAHLHDGALREANDSVGAIIGAALGTDAPSPSAEVVVLPVRRRG